MEIGDGMLDTSARQAGASASEQLVFESLDGPMGVVVRGIDWDHPKPDEVRLLTQALRRHLEIGRAHV